MSENNGDSESPFFNQRKFRAELLKEADIDPSSENIPEQLRKKGYVESIHYDVAVLSQWLRQNNGKLYSGKKNNSIGQRFRDEVNSLLKIRHTTVTDNQWRDLNGTFGNIGVPAGTVREIIEVLHMVPIIQNDSQLRASWNTERRSLRNRNYRFREVLSKGGNPSDFEESPLKGDYLIFRPDAENHINAAFLRFYHPMDGGVRMMGLRLDSGYHSYGSKGWLTQQSHGCLVTNYIVSRSEAPAAVEFNGGSSSIWVPKKYDGQYQDGNVLLASPCVHWQAINDFRPSFACGYLIRLSGYENSGGAGSMSPEQRHQRIIELQKILQSYLGHGFDSDRAAKFLASKTSCNMKYFKAIWSTNKTGEEAINRVVLPQIRGRMGMMSRTQGDAWCISRQDLERLDSQGQDFGNGVVPVKHFCAFQLTRQGGHLGVFCLSLHFTGFQLDTRKNLFL